MLRQIVANVVFVRDLAKTTSFYRDTLGLQVMDSDAESTGFRLGDIYFLLLEVSAAARLVSDAGTPLPIEGGPRGLLAASVDDVDAEYAALTAKGVAFLRPPTSQTWGMRTAHFADPEGNIWEINQPIPAKTQE